MPVRGEDEGVHRPGLHHTDTTAVRARAHRSGPNVRPESRGRYPGARKSVRRYLSRRAAAEPSRSRGTVAGAAAADGPEPCAELEGEPMTLDAGFVDRLRMFAGFV